MSHFHLGLVAIFPIFRFACDFEPVVHRSEIDVIVLGFVIEVAFLLFELDILEEGQMKVLDTPEGYHLVCEEAQRGSNESMAGDSVLSLVLKVEMARQFLGFFLLWLALLCI